MLPSRRTIVLALSAAVGFVVLVVGLLVTGGDGRDAEPVRKNQQLSLDDIPFDGRRAYDYLKQVCDIGPRMSGSEGMAKQQRLLKDHFEKLGGKVEMQSFQIRHPEDGSRVIMRNMIVRWHPDRKDRILLCAHYDTRPYPDRDPDPKLRRGTFIGANDGGSGVAVLMEMGQLMGEFDSRWGVDFVLFDGEEFVFDERRDKNYYFIGSKWFAQDYADNPPEHRYRWGILLDMVGDADLNLLMERNSLSYPETRKLVHSIWNLAKELGVREFIHRRGYAVDDDHIPLNEIAKIPTCNIIDFDYPHWHTTHDTVDKCSPESLAKVGWVVHEWLKRLE